jgi:3'-phosphoadenosine 5'-phosphosulfate (PAPS) 3'-phosphatase
MSEWDTAAPELILREAGGTMTDCTGSVLRYNKRDPRQPRGILAANPAAHLRALPLLQQRVGNQ